MITRRNIRVKVMQTIYTIGTFEQTKSDPQKVLQQHFNQTRSLLIYLIHFLTEVLRYAETDAHQRASKHLPTQADLNVNTKLAGNEILLKIYNDESLAEQLKKEKPELISDSELIRKIYLALTGTPEYATYISTPERNKESEKNIVTFILNDLILANETVVSSFEEQFTNWDDDGEMVVQIIVSYLQKPGSMDFNNLLGTEKASFAKNLLATVFEKNEYLESLIIPKLKNWDPERIAILDMIMMKMGVAEFLYFETIPPKVTINEYIDIAKEYSTQQSGHFVNGVLDNINKELTQQGKMNKIEYKKTPKP